jgi:hypothetical protein
MVYIGSRQITMLRGWVAEFKDGTVICEEDMHWGKVPNKKDIKRVVLKYDDRLWSFEDKIAYTVPTKRGYIDVSAGGISPHQIDSRTIGYYSIEDKCKVILRVDEATGKATWETVPFGNR